MNGIKGLSADQKEFFHEQGYLIVKDVFDPSELEPLRNEIAAAVDEQLRLLQAGGKLTDLHEDEPFETRLARVKDDSIDNAKAVVGALAGKSGGGMRGRAMFDVITHPKMLDVMESLVGPEIVASSVFRMRPKLPGYAGGVVPWHQDSGYLEEFCDKELIITCWLPLVDATAANGCMKILPRVHRKPIAPHRTGGNAGFLVIEDGDLPGRESEAIVAECPMGGMVLMTNLTPHCSTPNFTNHTRWSVDLRYQGADAPSNVEIAPEDLLVDFENVTRACYPPEADFLVRSSKRSEAVSDFAMFKKRRDAWEHSRTIRWPNRHWQPTGEKVGSGK